MALINTLDIDPDNAFWSIVGQGMGGNAATDFGDPTFAGPTCEEKKEREQEVKVELVEADDNDQGNDQNGGDQNNK